MNKAHEERVRAALNFAIRTHDRAEGPHWGINGKMSEFHAAIGLAQMQTYKLQGQARQLVVNRYANVLSKFSDLTYPWMYPARRGNFSRCCCRAPRQQRA